MKKVIAVIYIVMVLNNGGWQNVCVQIKIVWIHVSTYAFYPKTQHKGKSLEQA